VAKNADMSWENPWYRFSHQNQSIETDWNCNICNLSMVGFPASPLYPHWSIDEGSTMLNNAKKTQVRLDSRTKLLNPKFYEARRHGDEGFYEVPSMLWMVNNSKNNYNM
jgi:hypothetical protein